MALHTTSSFATMLRPATDVLLYETAQEVPMVINDKLFAQKKMKFATESTIVYNNLGLMKSREQGANFETDFIREGTRVNHTALQYGLASTLTREAIEDASENKSLFDLYSSLVKCMTRSYRYTREVLAASLLNRAFDVGVVPGTQDGVNLISASHVTMDSVSYSNLIPLNPDLSEAALETATIIAKRFKDERGLDAPLDVRHVVIPVELIFELQRILKSVNRVGVMDNDINAIKDMGIFSESVVSQKLTDINNFFVTTNAENGLTCKEKTPYEFQAFDEEKNLTMYVHNRWRGVYFCANPRAIIGSDAS